MFIYFRLKKIVLFQIGNQGEILVAVIQILAAHPPYKGIIVRSCGRVDRPFGRKDSLVALHPHMAGFVHLAHKVADSMVFRNLKVEISFHTAAVDVCRHCIPHTARSKFRHAHLQLAGRQHLIYQHLIDITVVGAFQRTHLSHYRISLRHFLVGIVAMSRYGIKIELGRMSRILALKSNFTVAPNPGRGLLYNPFQTQRRRL